MEEVKVLKQLTALKALPWILPLLDKFKDRDYSVEDLANWFVKAGDGIRCWIMLRGGDSVGYLIAHPTLLPSDAVHITEAQVVKNIPESVREEVMEDISDWARSLGRTRIMMVCQKRPKAFERKYGFKLHSYNMTKEVG